MTSGSYKKRYSWLTPSEDGKWRMPWLENFPEDAYAAEKCRSPTDFLPKWAETDGDDRVNWIPCSRLLNDTKEEKSAIEKVKNQLEKRKGDAFLQKQHVLPIRHLTHVTHQSQAECIRIQKPDGRVCATFRGKQFLGRSFETRGGKPAGVSGDYSLKSLGNLVWFGVQFHPSDAKKNTTERPKAQHRRQGISTNAHTS